MNRPPTVLPLKSSLERCARLRFAYDKEQVRLFGVRSFMKVLPSPDLRPIPKTSAGTWIELFDRVDRVLWTKSLGPVLQFDLELHNGTKGKCFTRMANPEASGLFDVIVPMLRGATGARLFSPPLRPDASHLPAEPRLQLSFDSVGEIWREVKQ